MLPMTEQQQSHARAAIESKRGVVSAVGMAVLEAVTSSRINYWLAYAFDLASPLVMAYLGWRLGSGHWSMGAASFVAGAFVFSFIEYAMHRWLFHAPRSVATAIHQTHHTAPLNALAIPCLCSPAAAFLIWSYLAPAAGEQCAGFFGSGLLAGYFCYSLAHHLQHSIRIKALPAQRLRRRWAAHAIHHGSGDRNFGVTSGLWDRVFGTYCAPKK